MTRVLAMALLPLAARHGLATDLPELLLEEAFYREVAAADLEGAAGAYQKLLAMSSVPPRIAARAHLRLGICYRLLGRLDLAGKHFEAVAGSPAAEPEAVKLARRHLGQVILDDPASFMPADVLFYAEIAEPAEYIRELSGLLKGTPFQNPVDYYVNYLGQIALGSSGALPAAPSAGPGEVTHAAAFLNEGFLREMQKIEGFAIGLPGARRGEEDFLAVVLPGKSDILRGLVQMGLTISKASAVGHARGLPIFQVPSGLGEVPAGEGGGDSLHFALGREVILFGRPGAVVKEAIERHASGSPSLADLPAFRDAQASRAGSLLFAHLGHERILSAIRSQAGPADLPALNAMDGVLGLGRLASLGGTLSWTPASDSIRIGLRARFTPAAPAFWRAAATPQLEAGAIPACPRGALGIAAFRLERGSERWKDLVEACRPFLDLLGAPGEGRRDQIEALLLFFSEGTGERLLDAIDSVAAGLAPDMPPASHPGTAPPPETAPGGARPEAWRSAFLSLRFRDAGEGAALLEEALTALLGQVFRNRASRSFEDAAVSLESGVEETGAGSLFARSIEPLPGFRILCARVGDSFVISPSERVIAEAARPPRDALPAIGPLPHGTGKAIFLRPSAWVGPEAGKGSPGIEVLLAAVPRAIITTREGRDGLSIELHVPGVTASARTILDRLAEHIHRRFLEEKKK